ncbi:helix-turn-helix transcriptional regulator [Yinghuangia sp. ASG 101]|uniref:helix-turn-helix domain-containing protein n=1 Tax=Yinghuangia sp. ASG 101 TaxID=2896848 RepID=UPI001E3F343C|nr:helix-turn-helix transcriptional regulator [Yinghuangia sp. ASG 101]UGQ15004.1 helix-turn-helix transcriptional regulator [Yinghuangia sp. ASG 101]
MDDKQTDSVVQRRHLGKALKRMRETCELTLSDVDAAGVNKSRLSRIENGKLAATQDDLHRLMELYSAARDGGTDPTAIAHAAQAREWWRPYQLDRVYVEFIAFEDEAAEEFTYHPTVVPGLLQTFAYARAVGLGNSSPSAVEKAEAAAKVRVLRQRVLTREGPLRSINYITETALRLNVGGDDVMREQLEHLLEAAELPTVEVRVLPFAAGEVAAHGSGATLLTFDDEDSSSVVFLSTMLGEIMRDRAKDVTEVERQLRKLRGVALPTSESLALIRSILKERAT